MVMHLVVLHIHGAKRPGYFLRKAKPELRTAARELRERLRGTYLHKSCLLIICDTKFPQRRCLATGELLRSRSLEPLRED